jgi:hypothetical protein
VLCDLQIYSLDKKAYPKMTKKNSVSLEDILGTPEEFRAAQAAEKKKFDDTCEKYRAKLLEESHTQFAAATLKDHGPYGRERDTNGEYVLPKIQAAFIGWQACKDFSPRLKFHKLEIVLPADEDERATAIDEFNGMLRAYVGNMCRTWGRDSVVRKGLLEDVEHAMAHARVLLTETEYNNLRIGLVNHGGRSEHWHYKAEK